MPNVKTITLTGGETEVSFGANYPYFWVQNFGDSDMYMSVSPNIVPDADGVIRIPAGSGGSTGDVGQCSTLYLLGTGKAQIFAQYNAVCPFKRAAKGGDIIIPKPAFLPYSEGLTYYFDVDNGVDLDQKVWRDQVQELEIPIADTQNFSDAVTNAHFVFPDSSGQWAYTYYTVSRYDVSEAWKLVIGAFGAVPQFNLTNNNRYYAIGTGSASGQMRSSVNTNGQFTINCLNYQSGYGEWYCHRYSMTQPLDRYTSYAAPNNGEIVLDGSNNFKAIAIFKNMSQGRDLILENMAFLKNKFELD